MPESKYYARRGANNDGTFGIDSNECKKGNQHEQEDISRSIVVATT